ncbi:hypothetical protein OESDEN_04849 [Oesophagostomum dentatum]|uniref:IgGFc-binding protein N-terminal domain-containing protein n=1 Tax=Oesophagostomum dentatum TaxID=61180 RepID=A0A0B1TD84_OESDE|nr:hypothetical protein OESDEN_04849 [Oesophagostomum dentatum]
MVEVPIPSWYGWQYESGGMQVNSGPRQLISANSTCPVTLIANNYDISTFQGDSYLVLPTPWAKSGSVFTFTLPPASNDVANPGNQHISIIPTQRDVTGTLTVFGSDPLPFTASLQGATTYFVAKTPKGNPHSYKIQADGPILVLAGVTCAGNYKVCDHASFMPQPLPDSACYPQPTVDDNHPTYIDITNGFYADIPQQCTATQQMKVSGNRGVISKNFDLPPTKQTSLLTFDSSFGLAVNMHAETAPVHVTRYHDLSSSGRQGAFIDAVASISQFITGSSAFYTRNDNDIVEVICVVAGCTSSTIDGKNLFSYDKNYTTVGVINGVTYYAVVLPIPTKGFHLLESTSGTPYSYYVVGQSQNSVYGYIGGINMAQVVLLPTTTPGPTTSPSVTTSPSASPSVTTKPSASPSPAPSSTPSTLSTAKASTPSVAPPSTSGTSPPPTLPVTVTPSTPSTVKTSTQPLTFNPGTPISGTTAAASSPVTTKSTPQPGSTAAATTAPANTSQNGLTSQSSKAATSQPVATSSTNKASSQPAVPSTTSVPATTSLSSTLLSPYFAVLLALSLSLLL